MKSFKSWILNLGVDGIIFGLSSIIAIVLGVLNFVGYVPMTIDELSAIIIGAIGALMLSVVALASRRSAEIDTLKRAIGISDSQIITTKRQLEEHSAILAQNTDRYILDTSLSRMYPDITPIPYFSGIEGPYRRIIFNRVRGGEIIFKRVEIIYHKQALEWVIFRLLLHNKGDYLIRHYEPSSSPIPILSFISFDDVTYLMGGSHLKGHPTVENYLRIREPNLSTLYQDYWFTLWNNATPLNENGVIDWYELRQIGQRLELSETDFDELVTKLEYNARTERTQL